MESKKEYCENLLNKYRDLKQKTEIKLFDIGKNGKLPEAQYIPFEYFDEFDVVRKEMGECLENFSEDILVELFDDFNYRRDINRILMERIKYKK